MLEELSLAIDKLEDHTILNIPLKIIFEVVNTIEAVQKLGMIDRIIGEIIKKQQDRDMSQQAQLIKAQLVEMSK